MTTMTMFNPPPEEPIHRSRRSAPSAVRFPFGVLTGWAALFATGTAFVYRLSQTGGPVSERACAAAIIISGLAAAAGIVPIYKMWGRQLPWVVLGVFLSGTIRLLIGLAGVVIIILFTAIQRTQFIGFLALFYVAFLALDTWLALWALRHAALDTKNQEAVHGNVWDIIVRAQSTRRGGQ
jgi:hypothetical protein